ncbi:MAG: trigger factor [Oscillospiraceae bacterium]|nr:trigger factor [Oscillospiraceae bacterium]
MIVKSVEKENGKATLAVEIEKDQFEPALNRAYLKNRGRIQVPGFRKGKAPRKVIEGMYGASVFYEDAIDELFPDVYEKAVTDNELKPVGRPSLTEMERTGDGGVSLTIEIELYPEVKLGQYLELEVPKAEAKVKDEEVEAELARLAERNARIVTVDRPADVGDSLLFDFEGFVDGKSFEGGKAENYTLKLGSGQFIPGFEEALAGVSAGEERDVNVTFPENYDPKLAGKDAVFHCKVHEVKETVQPELDDEFAKDVSEFDTLAEFRDSIRERLLKDHEEELGHAFENAAINIAAANMTCDIPNAMIEEQLDRQIQELTFQLQSSGMSIQDYVKYAAGGMENFRKNMRPVAEATVRSNILLSQIIEEEKIEASDEEVEAHYQKLSEQYKMELDKIKESVPADAVRNDVQVRKAIRRIADSAKPVAALPVEDKKEE